jgi:hypothetical protein
MLADIGNLIGLLVFAVIAIVSAMLKKKEKQDEQPFELPPELQPRRERSQAPPSRSWEEELRALLEDRQPPPPIVQQVPPPAPPLARPPVVQPHWSGHRAEVVLPPPQPREPVIHRPARLPQAEPRISAAAHLQDQLTEHFGETMRRRKGTTFVQRTAASAELLEVKQMLRSPRGVRAAIIASVILGPPRALE